MVRRRVLLVPEGGETELGERLENADRTVSVTTVSRAAAAHRHLTSGESFDCLVVGHHLPEMTGLKLLRNVRSDGYDLPVVFATKDDDGQLASDAMAAGATDYVLLSTYPEIDRLASRIHDAITPTEGASHDREQYETIVETVPEGVFVLDEEATVLSANSNAAEMIGFETQSRLVGMTIPELVEADVFHESIVEKYLDLVPELLSSSTERDTGRFEFRAFPGTDDERIFQVSIALRPFTDEYRGTIGIIRDITTQRRRQEELEQYETIIEAIPDPVFANNAEGRFTFVNEAMEELAGYQYDDVEGEGIFIGLSPEGVEKSRNVVRRLLSEDDPLGPSATYEFDLITRDGRAVPVETHLALLPHDGEFRGTAGITRDISDRRLREQRLDVLNRVLRHNLRNDLASVISFSELIARDAGDETLAEYAEKIRDTVFDIVDISDKIRDVQQAVELESRDTEAIVLQSLVTSVLDTNRERYPDARIASTVPDGIWVQANEALQTALSNLIENAVEHSDRDTPLVEVDVVPDAEPPQAAVSDAAEPVEWVELRVSDNGPGIPDLERELITGDAEITSLRHGSGLGLWVVDWIVSSVGGVVRVEDNDPRGSVVVISLQRSK